MTEIRHTSNDGIQALIAREGSRQQLYWDSARHATIGVGHLLTRDELSSGKIEINGKNVSYRRGLTQEQVSRLLEQDLSHVEALINSAVTVPLSQNQFDALVSFTFNVGGEAFRKSTLLRCLNAGNYDAVCEQLPRWRYCGGRVLLGLVARREEEVRQWRS